MGRARLVGTAAVRADLRAARWEFEGGYSYSRFELVSRRGGIRAGGVGCKGFVAGPVWYMSLGGLRRAIVVIVGKR